MSATLTVSDPAVLSDLMRRQAAAGFGFRNPVYRGALAGEYRLVELAPRARIPAPVLWRDAPKTLVVIGDDGGISSGPADFPQARRLVAWAERAMLHAAGGLAEHYALAADAARLHRRGLLIETGTAAEPAWMALLQEEAERRERAGLAGLAVLVISVPHDKPAHPVRREARV